MTCQEFEAKIGTIEPLDDANRRLGQCLMYNGESKPPIPLLRGTFWNIGYFREGVQPGAADLNWEELAVQVPKAHGYAEMLRDVRWQSSMSSPFFPVVLQLEHDDASEAENVKQALGLNVGKEFIDIAGDMISERSPLDRSLFWDADIDDEVEEYFPEHEITAYLQVTARMKADLQNLTVVRFPESYVRYPVFFVGFAGPSLLVGVAAFQMDK